LVTIGVTAESKYENVTADPGDGMGTLDVSVLCHHNLFSKEIRMKTVGVTNWSTGTSIFLQPDGTFDGRYPPGLYDLWLIDGNGAQYELAYNVEVKPGYRTIVRFIGHAISGHGNATAVTPIPTVTVVPTTIAPTPTMTTIPTIIPTTVPTTTVPTIVPTITPKPTTTPVCRWVCENDNVWSWLPWVNCKPNCKWVCT